METRASIGLEQQHGDSLQSEPSDIFGDEDDDTIKACKFKLGPDLLSRFLEDASKKANQVSDEARIEGSDKELRDIVLNFMIAGFVCE